MNEAIEQFRVNIERVRNLGSLGSILDLQTTDALDTSDILRAELVLAVSAFDHYIHEISRIGMLEIYRGNRPQPSAFLRFQVSMSSVLQGIAESTSDDWLEQEIRMRHGHQSFQQPDQIADAIRLISDVQLWNSVSNHIGVGVQDIRERLRVIASRRNQIAHEADMNPSYPAARWPIDSQMVDNAVDFIEQIAEAIYEVVA